MLPWLDGRGAWCCGLGGRAMRGETVQLLPPLPRDHVVQPWRTGLGRRGLQRMSSAARPGAAGVARRSERGRRSEREGQKQRQRKAEAAILTWVAQARAAARNRRYAAGRAQRGGRTSAAGTKPAGGARCAALRSETDGVRCCDAVGTGSECAKLLLGGGGCARGPRDPA